MEFGLVTFPSIKIALLRDFWFCHTGILSFGVSRAAAPPEGGKGAVPDPLWDQERDGNDYAGAAVAQLFGCGHARRLGWASRSSHGSHHCHQQLRGLAGWQGWLLKSWIHGL